MYEDYSSIISSILCPCMDALSGVAHAVEEGPAVNPKLEHNSIIPLYAQIIDGLREEIRSGQLSQGSRLPTERELAEKYDVSIITIRRAMEELCKQGLVVRKQGKGTFVCTSKMKKSVQTNSLGFSEMCEANGDAPGAKVICAEIVVPHDREVVETLGLKPGEQAVHLCRLRMVNDRPLVIEKNYYPMKYAGLLSLDLEHDSTYRYLREVVGVTPISQRMVMRIVRADAKTAKLLCVPRNTPQLQMVGLVTDLDGIPIHTSYQLGYGEEFDIVVR